MSTEGAIAQKNLIGFVRLLRSEGFSVGPHTSDRLVSAANLVGLEHHRHVRHAFRSVTATDRVQSERFDELFDSYFQSEMTYDLQTVVDSFTQTRKPSAALRIGAVGSDDQGADEETEEVFEVLGASSIERLVDVDFADLSKEEADAVAKLLASMSWTVGSLRSRRWEPSATGSVPNLRRTLKEMVGPKSDLIPLAMSDRRPRQRPLIVLADISGSMERYSEMLLHFVHGAQSRFRRIETFVFATRLTRVTRQLKRRDVKQALRSVTDAVPDWSSGTKIGEAIHSFNRNWLRRVGSGGPVVLVISDGWDTGDPALLGAEMRRLHRSVHRTVWLNPLAGHVGFTPEARGMAAAVPHIDELVAGGTVRNLEELIVLLQDAQSTRGAMTA